MKCPQCAMPLAKVTYPGGYLNRDQWESFRAGDWYCKTCPDNGRAENGKCYWWDSEVRQVPAEEGPIDAEWLGLVGFLPGDQNIGNPEPEYSVRIVGGDDSGQKHDSDDDGPDDEIADLVAVPLPTGSAMFYVETWRVNDRNTVALINIGVRKTRAEVLDLCRALKAWAVRYPKDLP